MYRIGRSHRSRDASLDGGTGGILPLWDDHSNPRPLAGRETVSVRQFDWGGRLLKCNGGAQRFPQVGRKPIGERKGKREPDCEAGKPSRSESWA